MLLATSVWAQKVVSVTVPFPPGGATDRAWRALDSMLASELKPKGIELVTDYRPGAGGSIGASWVAKTQPGQTRLLFTSTSIAIAPWTNAGADYQASDFITLGNLGSLPMIVAVPESGPSNWLHFKAMCHVNAFTFGSAAPGSVTHLMAEAVASVINCNATSVPYKNASAASFDLIAGRLNYVVDFASGGTMSQVLDGKLRAVLVIGQHRLTSLPNVPTSTELGLELNGIKNWQGFFANAHADPKDLAAIQQSLKTVLSNPANIETFKQQGLEGIGQKISPTWLADNFQYYQKRLKSVDKQTK